jgi:ABC-type enterochelin transport system substrate-binding protein
MKLSHLVLAASVLVLPAACATNAGDGAGTAVAASSDSTLQETASLMASITQHGDGVDIADSSAQLDAQIAAAPNDPYVLKLAALSRVSLSDVSQDRAERVKLRHDALAQYDKAISLTKPDAPSRIVRLNGQETEIDLKDLPDLRAQLFHTVQTDR